MKPTTDFRRMLRNATLGLGLAAVVGGAALAPAMAADYGHRDAYSHYDRRDVREPAYREHAYREPAYREPAYREHERFEPRYAYAVPSYRYYAPAPAYVVPSLNFGFTIR
ncbi:MAG TPA: hypothetical protein VJO12_00080 [Stellaceae bacterium]|nr:hypothetical protein [Stellaceae bacterium]